MPDKIKKEWGGFHQIELTQCHKWLSAAFISVISSSLVGCSVCAPEGVKVIEELFHSNPPRIAKDLAKKLSSWEPEPRIIGYAGPVWSPLAQALYVFQETLR